MFLSSLPLEIIDLIVSLIDQPSVLLSLALTDTSFKTLIIPHQIQFRHIRCDPNRKYLWDYLEKRPGLCANVRRLELVGEARGSKICIPRCVPNLSDNQSEFKMAATDNQEYIQMLVRIVPLMTRLRRFCWGSLSRDVSEFSILQGKLAVSCPDLEEVDVQLIETSTAPFSFDMVGLPLWKLSNLTAFALTIGPLSTPPTIYCQQLANLLITRCPSLIDLLIIVFDGLRIPQLLKQGYWKRLRRLTIESNCIKLYNDEDNNATRAKIMAEFLDRHDHLECLSIESGGAFLPHSIKPKSLPRLRSLRMYPRIYSARDLFRIIPPELAQRLLYFESDIVMNFPEILYQMPGAHYQKSQRSSRSGAGFFYGLLRH